MAYQNLTVNKKIAALGCLCGITAAYWDNFGQRHPTSQATYRALLTAMGVPWEDPERLDRELAARHLGPWRWLLAPVQAVFPSPGPGRLQVRPWTAALPSQGAYGAQVRMVSEQGEERTFETCLEPAPGAPVRAVGDGFRVGLELPLPGDLELGYYELHLEVWRGDYRESGRTRLIVAPAQAYVPEWLAAGGRVWGVNLPLYALRGHRDWGIGDFALLSEMTRWAGDLGAAFVGVNPLHAAAGHDQPAPSPYSPTSRLFRNILYLHLEGVPELTACRAAQELIAGPEFREAQARWQQARLVAHGEVYRWKRQVLDLLYQTFCDLHGQPESARTARGQEFARYLAAKGELLWQFGQFCALGDYCGGGDWRRWPGAYQHPGSPAVADFSREQLRNLRLYQYGQWLLEAQLAAVCRQARDQGLAFTLYEDLALGASPGGFDTWARRHLFAPEAAMGAPPDAFSPGGQNWGLPPLIPERLRQTGYQFFIDTLRANAPPGGMLRLDHVMGLFRLLWIPPGMAPGDGAYVTYPARELLAILALESVRRRTVIIGEDLGTVPPHIRRDLARAKVLSYRVFYFERGRDHQFLAPEDYPALALATVTTHDLPTLAGFWEGRDLALRRDLHLYPQPQQAAADLAARAQDRQLLVAALHRRGLLAERPDTAAPVPCPQAVRYGVLEYLSETPAALLEVRLEEIFGVTEQQNLPGTVSEHPNWRVRLPRTLAEMRQGPEAAQVAARLNRHRGRSSS